MQLQILFTTTGFAAILCSAAASRGSEAASAIAALPVTTASPTVCPATATEAASHPACATRTRAGVSARCAPLAQPTARSPPLAASPVAGSLLLSVV